MILFTIIGAIVWAAAFYGIGYALGWYLDYRRGIAAVLEPLDDRHMYELKALLAVVQKAARERK